MQHSIFFPHHLILSRFQWFPSLARIFIKLFPWQMAYIPIQVKISACWTQELQQWSRICAPFCWSPMGLQKRVAKRPTWPLSSRYLTSRFCPFFPFYITFLNFILADSDIYQIQKPNLEMKCLAPFFPAEHCKAVVPRMPEVGRRGIRRPITGAANGSTDRAHARCPAQFDERTWWPQAADRSFPGVFFWNFFFSRMPIFVWFPPSAVLSKKQILNPWISLLERLFPIQTSSLLKIHCYGCKKFFFFAFVSLFIHNSVYRFFETETTPGECKEAQYVSQQKPLLVDATGRFYNEYLFYWAPSRSTELAFESSCLRQRRLCIAY